MKKPLLLIVPFLLFTACKEPETKRISFPEPENPDQADPSLWQKTEAGLNISFASVDERYKRDTPPQITTLDQWNGIGWRGEKIHTQFLFWSDKDIEDISWKFSEFKDSAGQSLDSNSFEIKAVRYVLSDGFLQGCGYRNKDTIQAHIEGDLLEPTKVLNLQGQTTRPMWLSVNIPDNQEPGIYNGSLIVHNPAGISKTLALSVEVQNMVLPSPSDWYFHLDLWQNPFAVARFHKVPLWSQEHWDLLKPYLKLLADAGQKCITTSIIHRPWGGQTFDPFSSMIEWIKNSSGKWDYDYSVFDQYVQFSMDCGITEQINCYSLIPWGNKLRYFDEDSAAYVTIEVIPGTEEYENIWKPFLFDFRSHLKEMNWLEKTTLAMDERNMKEMSAMLAFIKKTTPELKITMAGHYFEGINTELYDFSYNFGLLKKSSKEIAAKRRKKGQVTTYYVACGIPKPNNFTFSPPAESTYEGWFAAAMGLDGFLRWAYNSWVEDPLMDTRFHKWPAGDTYFVYPGPRSSIRFERLREGIQDYEKIKILKTVYNKSFSKEDIEKLNELHSFLDQINTESLNNRPAKDWVNEGKEIINKLTR